MNRTTVSPGSIVSGGTSDDIVSNNTKVVLYGLFALVGFAVLMYAFTAVAKYNPDTWKVQNSTGLSLQAKQQLEQLNTGLREQRMQQLEQLNTVYVAAISGSLALGGTLIAQLWGRSSNNP